MRHGSGDEPMTLMRYHSFGLPQLYEAIEGCKFICDQAYKLRGIKGKILFFFSFLSFVSLLLWLVSWHICMPTPQWWEEVIV